MSLTALVAQQKFRDAFDTLATPSRVIDRIASRPPLVEDSGAPIGFVGTAFDLLARAQLARALPITTAAIHGRTPRFFGLADGIIWEGHRERQTTTYRNSVAAAMDDFTQYIHGAGDLRRLVDSVQYLALADVADRVNKCPDPDFRPTSAISDELNRLLEIFDAPNRYRPQRLCVLNPQFVASRYVGGADGDILIDDTLIDLKTTIKGVVTVQMLRQLAGYAALQRVGGTELDDGVHQTQFEFLELYFARHGKSVKWSIADLFPNDAFDRFCEPFRELVETRQTEDEEHRRNYEKRRREIAAVDLYDKQMKALRKATTLKQLLRFVLRHESELGKIDGPYSLHRSVFNVLRRKAGRNKSTQNPEGETESPIEGAGPLRPTDVVRALLAGEECLVRSAKGAPTEADDLKRKAILQMVRRYQHA